MAGKLQLEATGPQEKYFTINPDYTYFLEKFKKHSNFFSLRKTGCVSLEELSLREDDPRRKTNETKHSCWSLQKYKKFCLVFMLNKNTNWLR